MAQSLTDLAAAITAVTTAIATAVTTAVAVTAAAENDNKKNDYPAAVTVTESTHVFFLLSYLLKHFMNAKEKVLNSFNRNSLGNI